MRTNIEIDDKLMRDALRFTGKKTKRAVVDEALRTIVRLHRQRAILALKGKVRWDGDLDHSRLGRALDRSWPR
ncbi:MAG: type II toxin-antitoxin system VapB family antitoxin [Rhodospirillaceae bacterium]|nr:type II toxin-antitoxin system VapB family antitoxin [Rhodospirillaceae bacterium]